MFHHTHHQDFRFITARETVDLTKPLKGALTRSNEVTLNVDRLDVAAIREPIAPLTSLSDSKVFKSILPHPLLLPLFHGILGKGYRMDHLPFVIAQDKGAEGFQLHGGTVDCNSRQ